MSVFTEEDAKKRWFVTGGAGFIGSHVVDLLVSAGCQVTVYDNLSLSTDRYIADYAKAGKINFIQANLVDLEAVKAAMAGHDIVWHLGANTDIPSGYKKPHIDLDNSLIGTWNVLEAMRLTGVKQLLFASTGAVYGESLQGTFKESSGPLIPVSHYGAGKIACEAFICSFAGLYGIEAWIYRFGNVIGERTNHGIIYDFIAKLRKSPSELEVLGTGRGEKNYFLVEDCIQGMLYTYHATPSGPFPILVNLGTDSTSKIMEIAEIIIEEMGLRDVKYRFTGTPRGWPGDQPVVLLDTSKIHELGWYCRRTSNDAVRIATRRLLGTDKFKLSVETL
ncbi:MAG TPA: NAD-dependent epimerase/dehydratase family protein [Kofleriaceae bacterium]|nr:NAD-dependent epimerase/dehydratase family protein [Kofleriaceae bacterium]